MSNREEAIRRLREDTRPITGGEQFEVRFYQPEDGYGVARLMYAVYGDGYPIDTFYIPEQLTEANRSGSIRSVVARTDSGEVIGHLAFYRSSAPNPEMYEVGQGLTLPAYRSCHVYERCTELLFSLMRDGIVKHSFGEAVCNHIITQKVAGPTGMIETALEVDLMPASAYAKEEASSGRVSCLLYFRIGNDQPRRLCLPDCYEQQIRFMLEGSALVREIVPARDLPLRHESIMSLDRFEGAGVCRCTINEPGEDLAERLAALEKELRSQRYVVLQCFLPLGTPAAATTVETLRTAGFFLGGFLPAWFGDDGLLMQKRFEQPEFDTIKLYSERAGKILTMVRADWQRSQECTTHRSTEI